MPIRPLARAARPALAGALLATLALAPPAAAAPDAQDAPVIERITTENSGGGLSGHAHLFTVVVVEVGDATPSAPSAYRVRVEGAEPETFEVYSPTGGDDLRANVPYDSLRLDEEYSYTVEELEGGRVARVSAPQTFTLRLIGHPKRFSTSSTKVKGQWSYRAGTRARFRFRGSWEPGTRVTTQVWVSRTRTFTAKDWEYNTSGGALLDTPLLRKPVLSVRVPKALVGRYLWVSVVGWKDGRAGWTFAVPPERVIKR